MSTVLITGASKGLGYALAEGFLKAGHELILVARTLETLRHLENDQVTLIRCDLNSPDDLNVLLANTAVLEKVDVLINNAAMQGPIGPCADNDWQAWQATINLNFLVPVQLCRALVPFFMKKGRGKIINLSGGGATGSRPNFSAYASAKTALVRFTEVLADEVKSYGIDVNAIAPGAMPTQMLQEVLASGLEKVLHAGSDVIAKAVQLALYLASPESIGISGKLISAQWDPWQDLQTHRAQLSGTDIYTLRRIVPKDRGQTWGEV